MQVQKPVMSPPAFKISEKASMQRERSPTQMLCDGTTNIPQRSRYRRNHETLLAASKIHGASKENCQPAIDGLFSTINTYASLDSCEKFLEKSKKLSSASVSIHKKNVKAFELSQQNVNRSFAMLYAGGLLSKRKYEHNRSSLSTYSIGTATKKGYLQRRRLSFGGGVPIPKVLPYKDLMDKVSSIDIGELLPVNDLLSNNLPLSEHVDGVYRNLETLLLSLAKFYLDTDPFRKADEKLRWFGSEVGHFRVAVGGDGAPFGKWDEATSWLVSFLNVGPRIASPNDNFLLFGANCKENHEVVHKFCKHLSENSATIEQSTYNVGDVQVKFTFDLLPSDMKFLAFINGELSNSATYFSSFANAKSDDLKGAGCLSGTFGTDSKCKWKPWPYKGRIIDAKKVCAFKKALPQKTAEKSVRNKVTQYIASLKSRQEFEPLIGKLCENALIEPLHLKNNAVQKLHDQMLLLALTDSNLPSKLTSITEMPNCSMKRYLQALEDKVKATRLRKQLVRWLLDERSQNKDFSYRFTGKDSHLVLAGFMFLIDAIRGGRTNNGKLISKLLIIVFIAIRLRDSVSLFSMYHFSEEKLEKLSQYTSEYITSKILFYDTVTPSEWTIGKVVPIHAKWVYERYGTGLGVNTMQGREAKHVQIARYAQHSNMQNRWPLVFRHDYVSKIWLPLNQPSLLEYHRTNKSLVPSRVEDNKYCHCSFLKEAVTAKCYYCDHEITTEIIKSVKASKITKKLLAILK